jgi:hypothetical protein
MDFLEDQDYAWPLLLLKNLKPINFIHKARAGCSHWYIYTNFLKEIDKVDVVIFGHTSYARWPSLPDEYSGWNYRVYDSYYNHLNNVPTILKDINKYYFDIFPEELGLFLSKQIFSEVNRICKEKKKYLINIDIFDNNFELTPTEFPIIRNLATVSTNETININGTTKTMQKLINQELVIDKRACHLSFKNNHTLAKHLENLITRKPYNFNIDAVKQLEWDISDPHTDNLFSV